jgi:hypothetical protein
MVSRRTWACDYCPAAALRFEATSSDLAFVNDMVLVYTDAVANIWFTLESEVLRCMIAEDSFQNVWPEIESCNACTPVGNAKKPIRT